MNITLEDVLYLTGLPIKGEPLIPDNIKDLEAFSRVFDIPIPKLKLSLIDLKDICVDEGRPHDQRIKARPSSSSS